MRAVKWINIGTFATLAVYMVAAIPLDDPPPPPTWVWAVPALVAPAALAVYWRPAYRVESCFFRTGVCAFLVGYVGFGWGSLAAPVISGATIIAMFFAPRDGGWRERWGRAQADDDRRT
jgi:hypothetical protein